MSRTRKRRGKIQTDTETIFTAPGLTILPKTLAEAEEILRDYIDTQEFLLVICDGYGFPLADQIIRRFYWDAPPEDMFCCVAPYKGLIFGVIVMRRRLMLAEKYQFELKKQGVDMSQRELVEGGALIRVATHNRPIAREFAMSFLDLEPQGEGLGGRRLVPCGGRLRGRPLGASDDGTRGDSGGPE